MFHFGSQVKTNVPYRLVKPGSGGAFAPRLSRLPCPAFACLRAGPRAAGRSEWVAASMDGIDFEAMMGGAPNPYMVLDRDLRLRWANEAYLRAVSRSWPEIEGRELFEAFPPPDEATGTALRGSIERAFESGTPDELAVIEYPIRNPDGSMGSQVWSATHIPFRDAAGEVAYVLQHTVDVTELNELRAEAGVIERARAAERRYRGVAGEIAEWRGLLEQAPGFVAVSRGPEHRFVFTNAAYRRLLGERPLDGKTVREAVPEVERQGLIALLDRVYASGEPYVGRRSRIALAQEGSGELRDAWLDFIFQPIRDGAGEVWGIFLRGHDVTDQVEAEERQQLLMNELNHRVKNTLAVVQGLAQQSFGREPGDGERFAVFSARLRALAGAHDLLTAATWEAADLKGLVESSLEAAAGTDAARCTLEGPPVTLLPQQALTLAMIVHELATNAIKYGALSNGEGRVAVRWTLSEAAELALEWRESGGPPVMAPAREGFGARLIRRGLGGRGTVALDYRPEGLACRIEATL